MVYNPSNINRLDILDIEPISLEEFMSLVSMDILQMDRVLPKVIKDINNKGIGNWTLNESRLVALWNHLHISKCKAREAYEELKNDCLSTNIFDRDVGTDISESGPWNKFMFSKMEASGAYNQLRDILTGELKDLVATPEKVIYRQGFEEGFELGKRVGRAK